MLSPKRCTQDGRNARAKAPRTGSGSAWVSSAGIVALLVLFLFASEVSAGDENNASTQQPGPSDGLGVAIAVFQAIFKDISPSLKFREVRQAALATIGATRGQDPNAEIALPGAIGTAPQAVDSSRPLLLRWDGGAPPFQIELVQTGNEHRLVTTSKRDERLDLSTYPQGTGYSLTIAGKNDVRVSLPLSLVAPADVPLAQGIDSAPDLEARELVEAVWLLTQAPISWRLEALSRLLWLARDKNNIVAQAIVEPAPLPDEGKEH
jgi:hypothetical protein